ncbi:hemerythrin domain-containing protein [Sphingomonas solaris]|uniref:Hemerythrin domain-containing protein n=1 Tax=Alterirhizorhabdus solaris TaxID=2529389 RepID=A0A558RAN7_9SPHN|nr:hemerythrin domain-containing protein [Sphingomonas solaris]TVV76434.1 hemerythrin domain-containing protein [Sphingomonas solaris]
MSVIDKVIAAVTPPESEEARVKARQKARAAAAPGDWLSQIIDHHLVLEDAFARVKAAGDASARRAATKQLGVLLTGHAIAEESVIYPALAEAGEKAHSGMGYDEQALVKVQMALLEKLEPMSQDFIDKLEHIEGAVTHHMYQEEGTWFLELKDKAPAADQAKLTQRYAEEFDRYVGTDALA